MSVRGFALSPLFRHCPSFSPTSQRYLPTNATIPQLREQQVLLSFDNASAFIWQSETSRKIFPSLPSNSGFAEEWGRMSLGGGAVEEVSWLRDRRVKAETVYPLLWPRRLSGRLPLGVASRINGGGRPRTLLLPLTLNTHTHSPLQGGSLPSCLFAGLGGEREREQTQVRQFFWPPDKLLYLVPIYMTRLLQFTMYTANFLAGCFANVNLNCALYGSIINTTPITAHNTGGSSTDRTRTRI